MHCLPIVAFWEMFFQSKHWLFVNVFLFFLKKKELHGQGSRFDFVWNHLCEFYKQRQLFCLIESTFFIQRKKDCVTCQIWLPDSLSRRLPIAWFFFQRLFFFIAQQVVRRMWSNFIDLIEAGWFILPISWHPTSTSISFATLETDWKIMALPVKWNKEKKSSESQIFQGPHINICWMHSCRFYFISSKSHALSTFFWQLNLSHRINSAVLGSWIRKFEITKVRDSDPSWENMLSDICVISSATLVFLTRHLQQHDWCWG